MLTRDPYFTLRVETEGIRHEAHINGVPVSTDGIGTATNSTFPINQLLRSGENELSIIVPPDENDDGTSGFSPTAKAILTLQVQRSGALDQPAVAVGKLCFHPHSTGTRDAFQGTTATGTYDSQRTFAPAANGDLVVGSPRSKSLNQDGVLLASITFSFQTPFPEWEFLRSEPVATLYAGHGQEADNLYDGLLAAYRAVWRGLQSGDLDSIMPLFEERSANTDRAFYLPPGTTQRKLRDSFARAIADRSQVLRPIESADDGWIMTVGPTGRVMRLERGQRGGAILRFESVDTPGLFTVFQVTFRKKGDKFIIAL